MYKFDERLFLVGNQYNKLRKTICIVILDDKFPQTKNLEKPQTVWKIKENKEKNLLLTDYFEIGIIELPKAIKTYKKNPKNELLQWMVFLDNPEKKEVTQIMEENEDIKEAKEELEKISQDDLLRRRALNRTLEIADRLQFQKEAEEKGIKEGRENEKIEIVKEMYKENISIEQISKIVKLEEEKVKEILNI